MCYYLRKFRRPISFAILFQILYNGGLVLLNLVLIQMFQGVIDLELSTFFFWLVMDLLLFVGMIGVRTLRDYFQSRAILSMNNQVREDISATLLQKTYQQYHHQDSGEYLSWYTNDVNQIEQLAWKPFFDFIGVVANVIFSIVALLSLHWSLLAASLVTALIMYASPKLFKGKMEALGESCAQEQASAVSSIKDLLAGYDVLRFFGKAPRFSDGTARASDQIEKPKFHLTFTQAYTGNALSLISIICQLLTNALIGFLSIRGIIIQSALLGGGNLCSSIANGLNSTVTLRLSFASSKPYFDKITVHAEDHPAERNHCAEPFKEAISVDHLSFGYGEHQILQGFSIRFQKGGKYALTGPSGCGKSTLLKILLGWLPEYTGSIQIDGKDTRSFTPDQLQEQMSYIEQGVFLFNSTIRDNITFGDDIPEDRLAQAVKDSALMGDLASLPLGLDTPVGENGNNLSGGQKQRVAIARALVHNRSILLVDEGTSALDRKNADIVEKSLLSNPDLTLVLVSHHLSEERKAQFDRVFTFQPVGTSGG